MADPRAFLERWSRLKRSGDEPPRHRPAVEAPPATPPAAPSTAMAPEAAPVPVPGTAENVPAPAGDEPARDGPLAELPPLDTLTGDSDYTAFMRAEVPDALRNQALRKLWSSDPVYANLDGLLEYGDDFGEPFRATGAVATVYRVLQGMPGPDDEWETEDAEAEAAPPAVAPEREPEAEAAAARTAEAETDVSGELDLARNDGRDNKDDLD